MQITELRQAFLSFFEGLSYKTLPGASLIPEGDPSVLFTTAGMQQFKPYYTEPGEAPAKMAVTVQPVIRTSDIAEVGDDTHLTMFEMLGNFRFGEKDIIDLKKTAIHEAWKFIEEVLRVPKERFHATVFAGDDKTPGDEVSKKIWQELGVEVKELGRDDNFWGPTGDEGPCGPDTEMFVDGIEIGNLVFNEYYQDRAGNFTPLPTVGLDTGWGLDRLSTILQEASAVWDIKPYSIWVKAADPHHDYESRVIVDHLKAAIFLVDAGVIPGKKGREYILRRLIRKAVFLERKFDHPVAWQQLLEQMREFYAHHYKLVEVEKVITVFEAEKAQFDKNLTRAIAHLEKWLSVHPQTASEKEVTELAFYLYESFGFPKELLFEHLISQGMKLDSQMFEKLFVAHQKVSRAGSENIFKGGLADHEPQTVKHHTAHHLLLAALQEVLGPEVVQRGSNVTSERLRLDFNFDRKLTEEELKKVENIVNEKIKEDLLVEHKEMPREEALKMGAQAEFGQKYGDVVSVYTIDNFSKELCGGPHVGRTGELGEFKILKEEASSQGIRRIKAKVTG